MGRDHELNAESVARAVERLRVHRVRADRGTSLRGELSRLSTRYARDASGIGKVAEAWAAAAPESVRSSARLKGLSRGVLTITVPDASSRYRVERSLQSGLRRALIRTSSVTIREVRVRVELSGGADRPGG